MELVLDGEATPEQERKFAQKLASSAKFRKIFDDEKALHQIIKMNIGKTPTPDNLAEEIKKIMDK